MNQKQKNSKSISKPPITKIVILGVLTVLVSIVAWYSLTTIGLGEAASGLSYKEVAFQQLLGLIFPLLAFCAWLALLGLSAILIERFWILLIIFFLSALSHLIFFPFSVYLGVVFVIEILIFLYYSYRVKKSLKERLKFSVTDGIKHGLGIVIFTIILSISLVYFSQIIQEQKRTGEEAIDILSGSFVNLINQLMSLQFKDYNSEMTLDEFIFRMGSDISQKLGEQMELGTEEQLGGMTEQDLIEELNEKIQSGEINREEVPPEILEKLETGTLRMEDVFQSQAENLISDQLVQARDEFLKGLGIEARGTDTIDLVLRKIVKKYTQEFLGPYQNLIAPILVIGLFFILSVFAWFYKMIIKALALLFYLIMLVTHFVSIKKVPVEAEKITLE